MQKLLLFLLSFIASYFQYGKLAFSNNLPPQDTARLIARVDQQLSKGEKWVSAVLTDTALMFLHPLPAFREVIKKHAKVEKVRLTAPSEPGIPTRIEVNVVDGFDQPVTGALVYLYQTDARGWYADTAAHILIREGDRRHARLFAYLKTDGNGYFEAETIRPESYPHSSLPQHIHCEITAPDGKILITELLFRDDPKLSGDALTHALREGFVPARNIGTAKRPVFAYQIRMR
ncbi:MAG: hypothetical protein L6Q97_17145 [Thermoanaerobaculia bacterium]|nr:hypothetical protein [Thermoanaerobaculia bacterium]